MRKNSFFCLLIIILSLLAYSNSFKTSFHHDDFHTIVRNPFVKEPSKIPQFFTKHQMVSGIYSEVSSSYRPLWMVSFALNHSMGGLNVFGYHVVNFFLHIFCCILVYFITLYIFRFADPPTEANSFRYQLVALFAALVFGLHPVQTESVTYITGRSSSMVALFFLASFLSYMQYSLNKSIRYLILSSLAYACALMVKETAITLLAIVVLFNFMFLHGRTLKNRFLSLLPYFLLTVLYLITRIYLFGSLQYSAQPVRSLHDNLLSQTRAWIHYLGTLILPLNLNVDYDFPVSHSIMEGQVILSIFLLAALSLLIWKLSKSNRLVGFFALWFAITLLPTNSVVAIEDLVCDRWLYLSSVGYAVLLALAAEWVFQKRIKTVGRPGKIIFFFFCSLVIELYGVSTLLRNFDWTNQRTLWEDAVAKSPGKARPYVGLGLALLLENRLEEAAQKFQQAIAFDPRAGQAYLNLGYVYSLQGNLDKAIGLYQEAIPLNPKLLPEVYNNLGIAYLKLRRMEKSEEYLRKAIEIRPHNAAPHYNLALYFEERGDINRAISYQEKAQKLDPDYSLPYEALSRLYERRGWSEKSREAYQDFLKTSAR